MIGELLKAIKSRWDAKDLISTFTGGITFGQLRPVDTATKMPFVTVEVLGATALGRATSTAGNSIQQYQTVVVDFIVRARGGLSVCSGLVEQLKDVYNNMHATLTDGVSLKRFFWNGENVMQDPDHPNVWDWTISYTAEMEQAQTAVNI